MATTNETQTFDDLDDLDGSDSESLNSLLTDDGQDHPPEKILARAEPSWYLVKWKDCSVLRSSWEGVGTIWNFVENGHPALWDDWHQEVERQEKGLSKPFDIQAFDAAVEEIEKLERQRRVLRRLKKKINRVLYILTD